MVIFHFAQFFATEMPVLRVWKVIQATKQAGTGVREPMDRRNRDRQRARVTPWHPAQYLTLAILIVFGFALYPGGPTAHPIGQILADILF
ncbi:MAG: hypothetical protein AAF667_06065 [Pseudomonadota bacterium]